MSGRFKQIIGPLLTKLNQYITSSKEILAKAEKTDADENTLHRNAKSLKGIVQTLEKWNDEWLRYINGVGPLQREDEEQKYTDYKFDEKHFYEMCLAAGEVFTDIDHHFENATVSDEDHQAQNREPRRADDTLRVNLPKLSLPEFNGDPHNWLSFWQRFQASIDNEKYKPVDKMQYLFSCLSSKAKEAVSDLQLTDENYKIAIDILKKRFGDAKILKESLMAKLLKLSPARNDRLGLKIIVEEMEKIFRQLSALGEEVNNPILKSMIKSKLPEIVLLKIVTDERESGAEWDMNTLRKFLLDYVSIKDSVYQSTLHFQHEKSEEKGQKFKKPEKPPYQSHQTRTFAATSRDTNPKPKFPCVFCELQNHFPQDCRKFPSWEDRSKRLSQLKRCYRCFSKDHRGNECRSSKSCRVCNGSHHTTFCKKLLNKPQPQIGQSQIGLPSARKVRDEKPTFNSKSKSNSSAPFRQAHKVTTSLAMPNESSSQSTSDVQQTSSNFNLQEAITANAGDVILMASMIKIFSPKNPHKWRNVLVFWDSGSQSPYITHRLVRELTPPKVAEGTLEVNGFQSQNPIRFRSGKFIIGLQRSDGKTEEMVVYSTKQFTRNFKAVIVTQLSAHPTLAEVTENLGLIDREPELMIGLTDFWRFFISKTELSPDFYLIQTVFGPIVCGRSYLQRMNPPKWQILTYLNLHTSNSDTKLMDSDIKSWWDFESLGINEDPTENEGEIALQQFKKSIRLVNGRYRMKWLWRQVDHQLPSNYNLAFKCLESVHQRLLSNSELLKTYDETIQNQLTKGIIEVADRRQSSLEHYLPHHPVVTHKVRLVYNASAKVRNGKSLNDCLYMGPDLLPDLTGLLLRFRLPKYPVWFDIEKAFLQLELEEEDREVVKFLWLKDTSKPLTNHNLIIYRFCRVAFGINCSPFLLNGTVRLHLEKFFETSKLAVELSKNAYVDNFLAACETKEEILNVYKESKDIFSQASMNLREYITNCPEAMSQIPVEDRLPTEKPKILGIRWNLSQDFLEISLPSIENDHPVTRRTVLQEMASLFDPLGLISPCVIEAKLLFQKSWDAHTTWDEILPEELIQTWQEIRTSWRKKTIEIPRRILPGSSVEKLQLHSFVDASINVYAVVVFLRVETCSSVQTSLIYAKNRLKPKSTKVTIPRMELLALLIGVRALKFVSQELGVEVNSKFLWGDSKAVLSWVNSDCDDTKPRFIANRLKEIRKHTDCIFNYVPSEENSADILTKGKQPEELRSSSLWWIGPHWLADESSTWPQEVQFTVEEKFSEITPADLEKLDNQCISMPTYHSESDLLCTVFNIQTFSKWKTFLATSAVIMKFCALKFEKCLQSPLAASKRRELANFLETEDKFPLVEKVIFKIAQRQMNYKSLQRAIFIDSDGLVRLKTRIVLSDTDPELHSPIVLPKNSVVLKLLILDIHQKHFHSGVESTLTNFLATFWTPQARRTVKNVLRSCQHCRRMKAYPFQLPEMPQLPKDRVQRSSPFSAVGIDYLGPTLFKENGQNFKVWVVILTCLSTRAVYLEPIKNLSTESLLLLLRRFAARRGRPEKILSDNGTSFVQAAKICKTMLYERTKSFQWKFINQLSPWQGAVYERLVALVKNAFRRTLGRTVLEWDQLCTFVSEVESTLNLRPLTIVEESPEYSSESLNQNCVKGHLPLRPIDFLQPKLCLELTDHLPSISANESRDKLVTSWLNTLKVLEHFWKVWSKDYLIMLRERSQWHHKGPRLQTKRSPEVGEVVLVEEDFVPRNLWHYGRIVELIGNPNSVRNVKLLTSSGRILSRPINRLYPLELDSPQEKIEKTQSSDLSDLQVSPEISNEKLDTQQEQKEHPMTTRSKAKLLASSLALLLFIFALFGLSSASSCPDCKLTCSPLGIFVESPQNIDKIEICCEKSTCSTKSYSTHFEHEIDPELLLQHYQCKTIFWEKEALHQKSVHCEPKDGCSLVTCTFCRNFFANPHCWPDLAATLYGLVIFLSFVGFCFVFAFIRMTISNLSTICKVICVAPLHILRNLFRRTNTGSPPSIIRRTSRRRSLRVRFLENQALVALISILFIQPVDTEVTSFDMNTVECARNRTHNSCITTASTTLTLLSNAEDVNLLIRDDKGLVNGNLRLVTRGFTMYCQKKTHRLTRSYRIDTVTVKRCPAFGSCVSNFCDKVYPNTTVSELTEWSSLPGNNNCMDTCSFFWCNCPTVTAGCLFYRNFVTPLNDKVYELFTCPEWQVSQTVRLELTLNGKSKVEQIDLLLYPTQVTFWENKHFCHATNHVASSSSRACK